MASEPIARNAVPCGICQAPADRYDWGFQCQAQAGHVGDLIVGIFSDLTPPSAPSERGAGGREYTMTPIKTNQVYRERDKRFTRFVKVVGWRTLRDGTIKARIRTCREDGTIMISSRVTSIAPTNLQRRFDLAKGAEEAVRARRPKAA